MNLDENLLVYNDAGDDKEHFYVHDGLGTVRQIVDSNQTVQNSYDYEGFGTSVNSTENIYNRYRYTGREYDAETETTTGSGDGAVTNVGLFYYCDRNIDSSANTFISCCHLGYQTMYKVMSAFAQPILYNHTLLILSSIYISLFTRNNHTKTDQSLNYSHFYRFNKFIVRDNLFHNLRTTVKIWI